MNTEWQTILQQSGAVFQHNRVVHYGNLQAELAATLQEHIITDLSYKGLISVTGPDALTFLQGQLTCDVQRLNATHSSLGAHCNPKGRILSAFRIFLRDEHFYMFMPATITAAALAHLQKYAIFSKVTIKSIGDSLMRIGYSGPEANTHLSALLGPLPNTANAMIQVDDVTLINVPGPMPRFELFAPPEKIFSLWKSLIKTARPAGADAWQLLHIMAGIPTIYPATTGRFTPHQINYPKLGAVSFNKGCYIGQEIVARMEYLGKLKSHMHRAEINCKNIPRPGNTLFCQNGDEAIEIGSVIIAKPTPSENYQLLAVVKDEFAKDNVCYLANEPGSYLRFLPLAYA